MGVVLGSFCFVEAGSIIKDGYTSSGLTTMNSYKLRWPSNLLFFTPVLFYMVARMIVIIETIITLRLLPAGYFEVVKWSELLQHL